MAESFRSGLKGFQLFCFIVGVPFLIFGIVSFRQISEWGVTWQQRKAMVESGALRPLEAEIVKKWEEHDRDSRDLMISLQIPGQKKKRSEDVMKREVWESLQVGQTLKVYPVDDTYFIPTLHTGGHEWGRWLFLCFGAGPMILGFLVLIGRSLWRRQQVPGEELAG